MEPESAVVAVSGKPATFRWILEAVLFSAMLALAIPAVMHFRETPTPDAPEMRLEINTPAATDPMSFALSPMGDSLYSWLPATVPPASGCGHWPQWRRGHWRSSIRRGPRRPLPDQRSPRRRRFSHHGPAQLEAAGEMRDGDPILASRLLASSKKASPAVSFPSAAFRRTSSSCLSSFFGFARTASEAGSPAAHSCRFPLRFVCGGCR